jgi:aldehyde dehydrogenase (NAD+)
MSLPLQTKLFINNEFVDSVDGATFETVNPATEQVIATLQAAGKADVDKAVAAARSAFQNKWERTTGSERRDLLNKLADLIEKHADRLAEVESLDNGKPRAIARMADVALTIQHFRYFAGWADKGMCGKTIPLSHSGSADKFAMTVHEPIGVVGCIIPWNFPLLMLAWKFAPILASGCTCVMKTSEKTPLSALLVCQLVKEAGFPPGVVNVLSGFGSPAGEAIARHKDVDKICFTGSSSVGHKIIEMSAQSNMKRVSLELGGKSPMIVCEDADLDQAAEAADLGLFFNMGQCCCASSRVLVEESVHDAFVAKCVERAKAKKLLSPTDPDCAQGPVVDKIQFSKVMGYIESGKAEGAKLEVGGSRHGEIGFWVQPTIFSNVQDNMKICKEEIFGPVLQCLKFKTIDEAVQRANDTPYGLAAGVCCRDIGKAMGIAKRLKAGSVWINCWNQFDDATPFGGYKTSGWGREKSEYALSNFTEVKCIQFPINDQQPVAKKQRCE